MKTTTFSESEYDTYIGWKNRGHQVMKGEHSEPNHLGERVFHVDQTRKINHLDREYRKRYHNSEDPWDFMDDLMYGFDFH